MRVRGHTPPEYLPLDPEESEPGLFLPFVVVYINPKVQHGSSGYLPIVAYCPSAEARDAALRLLRL